MLSSKNYEQKLSKYEKAAPHFLYSGGNMHLYLSVDLYLYAKVLLKHYLISFYAHLLHNIRLF